MTEAGPVARAAALAALGLNGPISAARLQAAVASAEHDEDPRVRAAALGAVVRSGDPAAAMRAWNARLDDPDPSVRRRVAELAPRLAGADDTPEVAEMADVVGALAALLEDEPGVAETAAWALGELADATVSAGLVPRVADAARRHADPLVREAAVAALGAMGDSEGLDAILAACRDRPAIRRRAVLALAPFDGPEVEAALTAALEDRDWQVRQAAEDLRA